jgi:imidazolonepropionase
MSGAANGRLLVRDLAQLATPHGRGAPLRGPALRDVHVLENAYVLCRHGTIEAVGRMQDLPTLEGDVDEIDGRGLCAIPGLVDCHTHACFAGDRVDEFALRAGGASYEELHAAGGGIMSTVAATRAAGEAALVDAVQTHRGWMLRAGTTTFEAKSGYGLDRETELASLRAIARAGGVPTWLGAHAVPPEFDSADAYLDFALSEVLPDAAELAEAADVFLERGAFDARQARRYLEACAAAGLALRLHGDQFTEQGAVELGVALGASSIDHLEATGAAGVAVLAGSDVVAVLLPASALFLDRPMPPARALVDAGAAVALATDFNPGSAYCESLPLVCSLAATQLKLSPAEALSACTVNAAHVLRRGDRVGRLAAGYAADIVLLDAPDWRYLAYHLGGQLVAHVVTLGLVPTKKQRRRQQKSRRHEYEYVFVDDDGNEVDVDPAELRTEKQNGKSEARARSGSARPASGRAGRTIEPPSWRRALKRAAVWGPLLVVAMMLLNRNVAPLQWATSAVFLIAFFVPISYFTDAMAYRMYRKRLDRVDAPKTR